MLKCTHDKHAPLEGKYTRNSAFYPGPLCQIMLHALFPHVINAHVFCMPCTPRANHAHRQHRVKGMPRVPIDVIMHESGCKVFVTPAYVHRLERDEWKGRAEVYVAIQSEKDGLVSEGTWIESEIRAKADVIREFPGETLHFGALMVIVSVKGYEKSPADWKLKARMSAIFQDLASSAPSSISALNAVIAFSMIEGNSCTTSDCVRAYIQSALATTHRTFGMLPPRASPAFQKAHPAALRPIVQKPLWPSRVVCALAGASFQNLARQTQRCRV